MRMRIIFFGEKNRRFTLAKELENDAQINTLLRNLAKEIYYQGVYYPTCNSDIDFGNKEFIDKLLKEVYE